MLLKFGSTGDEVKKLQAKLGVTPTGYFGPVTEEKVKEWQQLHHIEVDGVVGDITWGLMFPSDEGSSVINPPLFNHDNLKGHIPDEVIAQIPETSARFDISNVLRLSHFLAQCSHESGEFTIIYENLRYSAERLKVIFPGYFPGNLAESYAYDPVRIGSRVYANRMGNGDEASGEGYKYRGRGYIQLTGKNNYSSFANFIGEDTVTNPDLVAEKYPLASAGFFFHSNGIWTICDRGDTTEVVTAVTKAVNGGYTGLSERIRLFNEFYNLLK